MNSAGVLRIRGLHREIRGRTIVGGVDLEIRAGEIVGLLGPNGAGKSTCFRMIVGLEQMDSGTVELGVLRLDGLSIWKRVRAGLGYLPQESSVFLRLSVRDNVQVALDVAKDASRASVDDLLVRAGLGDLGHQRAGSLSGGERRRLEIARCLAMNPKFVLFDEPFAGVDPLAVSAVKETLRGLAGQGIGVLVTDHAVHETLTGCDRAVILDAGTVVASGTPEEVSDDPNVRARYLGANFEIRRPAPH